MLNRALPASEASLSQVPSSSRALDAETRFPILAVDDEPRIVQLLRRELGRDFRVFTATSGKEALEILEREFVVVVLADQRMPEMSGSKLLEQVVQKYPHTIRILLTGYTDTNALVDAINKGQVYRYVSKPWEPEELKIIVRQGIERYQLREQNQLLVKDLKSKNFELFEALQELRKAQEELLRSERLSTVGKMANMIVHDIKNPLTSVLGLTDMLLQSRIDDEGKKQLYYSLIHNEAERILRMVREILDYVRGEGPTLVFDDCSLTAFLQEVAREIEQYLNGTGVRFRLQSDCTDTVRLDKDGFKRVLHNLAANAREAMPDGGELLFFATQEQGVVVIRVSDTGKGIPPPLHEKVFEPFFTQGKHSGSGLGLAIAKRVVDAHSAQICLESSSPAGTTFCIRLSPSNPGAATE